MLRTTLIAALVMLFPAMATAQDDDDTTTEDTRDSMEQSFGADLSDVRVHTGSESATMSESVGASAYTTGNDVALGDTNNEPGAPTGRNRLMANELAHTLQQQSSATDPEATDGGSDEESEDESEQRIPASLRHRDRVIDRDEVRRRSSANPD